MVFIYLKYDLISMDHNAVFYPYLAKLVQSLMARRLYALSRSVNLNPDKLPISSA